MSEAELSKDDLQEVVVTAEKRSTEVPLSCTFPTDLNTRFPGKIEFKPVNEQGDPTEDKIELPIPVGLTFADGAVYDNAELDALAGAAADGKINMDDVKTFQEGNLTQAASTLVKDMAARVGGNKARAIMGRTPNPNTRALFKQVNLRTFQFNYKLVPESEFESLQIQRLIRVFRSELYPTSTSTNPEDFQTGYFFPNRFQIKIYMMEDGKHIETKDVPKIQPAYLSAFQVSYNSGGSTMFIDPGGERKANFSEVDISLTFMESRTLFKPDVRPYGGF